jgi:Phosphotransferase enzyme family
MPVKVMDPFGVAADPALGTLPLALDPGNVKREFKRGLPLLAGPDGFVRVKRVRVLRYKPGKRCLIEYDVRVERPDEERRKCKLIGKIRARRFGMSDFRLMQHIWQAGFNSHSPDGIAVPEPVGVIPKFRMWLQLSVNGQPVGELLAAPDSTLLARRVAEAAHKLHCSGVPTRKTHTMSDEVRILEHCMHAVATVATGWKRRLERLLGECWRLAETMPEPQYCGVHRDFYPDQVLYDGRWLHLLDFDLYCRGDPGLDIGNFLGHVAEHSLRMYSDPEALRSVERALEERFVELSGERVRPSVRAYAVLTLVRHIYLSTRFPDRRRWTERLLYLCEQRLGVADHPATTYESRGAS